MSRALSYFERFLLDRDPLGLLAPINSAIEDFANNYAATIQGDATVDDTVELVSGVRGALPLGEGDYVTTDRSHLPNLMPDPSFEGSDWSVSDWNSNHVAYSTDYALSGASSLKLTAFASTDHLGAQSGYAIDGGGSAYTLLVTVYSTTERRLRAAARTSGGAWPWLGFGGEILVPANTWTVLPAVTLVDDQDAGDLVATVHKAGSVNWANGEGVYIGEALLVSGTYPDLGGVDKNPYLSQMRGIAVGGDQAGYSAATISSDFDAIVDLGADWVRLDVDWSVIETADGTYDWTATDLIVNAARSRGLKVLAMIGYTPSWARTGGTNKTPPDDPADFADFCSVAVARYEDSIQHWEVWNEPNISSFWTSPDPAAYVALLNSAYTAIKAADPDATVLTGGLAPSTTSGGDYSPYDFLDGIYTNSGTFDAVGHHPYCYPADPGEEQSWSAWWQMQSWAYTGSSLRGLMIANGDEDKLIWATEWGAPTDGPSGVTEAEQASMVAEAIKLWATYDWAGPLFVYEARDLGTDTGDSGDWFGLLSYDGTAKPSRASYVAGVPAPSLPLAGQTSVVGVARRANDSAQHTLWSIGQGRESLSNLELTADAGSNDLLVQRLYERLAKAIEDAAGSNLLTLPVPDPDSGTVIDRTGNYTYALQGDATVTTDELEVGEAGATSLDGTGDYISSDAGTRRNLITNPSLEVDTTGWNVYGTTTLTQATDWSTVGSGSLRVVATTQTGSHGAQSDGGASGFPVSGSTDYTVSLKANVIAAGGTGIYVVFRWWNGAGASLGFSSQSAAQTGTGEKTFTLTATSHPSAVYGSVAVVNGGLSSESIEFKVDEVMAEQASSADPYFDGTGYVDASGNWQDSDGIWCGWLGAAHASASDYGVLGNGKAITLGGVDSRDNQSAAHTLIGGSVSSNATQVKLANGSGDVQLVIAGTTYTWTGAWPNDTDPHTWAVEFDETADTADLYIDGSLVSSKTGVSAQHAASQSLVLGAHGSGSDAEDGKKATNYATAGSLTPTQHAYLASVASEIAETLATFTDALPDPGEAFTHDTLIDTDAGEVSIAIDGVDQGGPSAATLSPAGALTLGARADGSDRWRGELGVTMLDTRAPTTTERRMRETIRQHGGPFPLRRRR